MASERLWERSARYDKRSANGHGWNADAWRHTETGEVRWTYVGNDMNTAKAKDIFVIDLGDLS